MNIPDRISFWLINRLGRQCFSTETPTLLTIKNQNVLILTDFDQNNSSNLNQNLKETANRHFGMSDVKTFYLNRTKKDTRDDADLHRTHINLRGFISDEIQHIDMGKYSMLINLLSTEDVRTELWIARIQIPIKIRFNRNFEKNYNFIVPLTDEEPLVRLNKFIQVYQTLAK